MDYNIIMYIGISLIIGGFLLFLYCQMKEREADKKLAQLEQSFNRSKNNG